jgi:hypothetical protein
MLIKHYMNTSTKYLLGFLDLIAGIFELPMLICNFLFAKWTFNKYGQYSQKNIFYKIIHWATLKSMVIRFKIEDKELE